MSGVLSKLLDEQFLPLVDSWYTEKKISRITIGVNLVHA
jgi:hypothetical protein